MKFVIILSIVAVTLAKEYEMHLEENGEKFTEKLKIDVAGNTEEIKVPKHGDRAELDLLNDFNVGYRAMKLKAARVCYISAIRREQIPRQMELSMQKSQAKFSTESYRVNNDKIVRLYKMSDSEVGAKIAAHCAGYDMIFTMKFKKDSDVAKIIQSHLARTKRSGGFREFTACDGASGTRLSKHCKHKKIFARCKMLPVGRRSCVYNIRCDIGLTGWKCDSEHNFTLPFCCILSC